jgi:pimeloyl-ACP methyl ester carboxylesterase
MSPFQASRTASLRLAAAAACLVAFLLGWVGLQSAKPESVRGTLPLAPPTPYVRFIPESQATATAIVLHGLNSNKEFMQTLAMALADADIEVYVIDLPGHGDSSARFTYTDSLRVVENLVGTLEGELDIVIGHSMGGSLLADLAPYHTFPTMLLLSPAPIAIEDFSSERFLVVTGTLEAPRVNEFVPALVDAAGGETLWWKFPDATHSTALFDPDKIRRMMEWLLNGETHLRTLQRYGWLTLMALAAIAPAIFCRWKSQSAPNPVTRSISVPSTLVGYVGASAGTALLLRFVNPMGWLDIFALDYLAGMILLTGVLLWRGRSLTVTGRSLVVALISAAYVIGILLIGVVNNLVHSVPSGVQWLWFPILTLVGFPLFLYDNEAIRPIPSAWKRWGTFLLTRLVLWATTVTGVLLLSPEASFLVLIMHFVVVFWLVLWWMTGIVHKISGEPLAAALFAALIQAWVFASLSVRV